MYFLLVHCNHTVGGEYAALALSSSGRCTGGGGQVVCTTERRYRYHRWYAYHRGAIFSRSSRFLIWVHPISHKRCAERLLSLCPSPGRLLAARSRAGPLRHASCLRVHSATYGRDARHLLSALLHVLHTCTHTYMCKVAWTLACVLLASTDVARLAVACTRAACLPERASRGRACTLLWAGSLDVHHVDVALLPPRSARGRVCL